MTKLDYLFVIVPGIGGSVLADESGKKVWKPDVRSVGKAMCRPEDLAMDRPLVPTGLFTDFHITPFWLVPGYSKITKRLSHVFQEAVTTAHPTDHVDPDASIVNFPYDFRQSIWKSAEALGREIAWRLEHRKRRVVIYAHSMGGLVAAWWWGMLGGHEVTEHIITLGTPFRGATKALDMLINGVRLGPLPLDAATGVLRGWDSIYDLVPKYRTIRDADTDVYPHDLSLASDGFRRRAKTSYERFQEMATRIGELVKDPVLLGAGRTSTARVTGRCRGPRSSPIGSCVRRRLRTGPTCRAGRRCAGRVVMARCRRSALSRSGSIRMRTPGSVPRRTPDAALPDMASSSRTGPLGLRSRVSDFPTCHPLRRVRRRTRPMCCSITTTWSWRGSRPRSVSGWMRPTRETPKSR